MLGRVLVGAALVTRTGSTGVAVGRGVRLASGGISGSASNNVLFALGFGIMGVTFYSVSFCGT